LAVFSRQLQALRLQILFSRRLAINKPMRLGYRFQKFFGEAQRLLVDISESKHSSSSKEGFAERAIRRHFSRDF